MVDQACGPNFSGFQESEVIRIWLRYPGVALVFGCNIRRADYFLRGANDTDLHQMLITLASHVIDADRDGPKLAVAVDRLPGTG